MSAPELEESIDCIDCGGRCHLMVTWAPDNPPYPGDVVVYRCEDCLDRWDIVVIDPDDHAGGEGDGLRF